MSKGDKVWINYSDIDTIGGCGDIICEGIIVSVKPKSYGDYYIVEYQDEYYPYGMKQREFAGAFLSIINE